MTQHGADSTALIVSIIALVVAVIAAGFTGWQAVTEHLARTRSPKARWAFEYPSGIGSGGLWKLHNTGGSIATAVKVRVTYSGPSREDKSYDFKVDTPIRPGGSQPVPGTENRIDPRKQVHKIEGKDEWKAVDAGTVKDAYYPTSRLAHVTWTDYRGHARSADVPLR